ncbi:MCE family protein [Nonomuraea sp. MG754425]|uniref:MCE family protein n=1 Tax=Nonomuraea sp. MG754425 TaxID=2570319 RepID=UPI001F3C9CD2|nr:MCE family protein [Nonomuraea sp. MG754425]MCF6476027.1 MCE family protein [Nonomuraea sp. MG754425]
MRRTAAFLLLPGLLGGLAGCGFEGVASLPLPGGADLGARPYEVRIEFEDALDLVPRSLCKVDDVTVGEVTGIELGDGWRAEVVCAVRGEVPLPDATTALIAQTSLLGEKFVKLVPAGRGRLSGPIPVTRTSTSAEVEQVLSAASLLVNGGGLDQLATINTELGQALGGRSARIKGLLRRLGVFVAGLDGSRKDIVRLMDGLDGLTSTLARQRGTIKEVATGIGPAVKRLRRQRRDLTRMLTALDRLGRTATRVVERSGADTLANLRHLSELLSNLDRARHDLVEGVATALTFPFPGSAASMLRGDYGNADITVDVTPATTLDNLLGGAR